MSSYSSNINIQYTEKQEDTKERSHKFIFNNKVIILLYEKCKENFEAYLKRHENSMNFVINNSTQKKIKAKDYFSHRNEDKFIQSRFTPLLYMSRRKLFDENDQREYYHVNRSIVSMRRLEYTNVMQRKASDYNQSQQASFSTKIHYTNSTPRMEGIELRLKSTILIQASFRGFSLRKLYHQVFELNHQLTIFFYAIKVYKLKEIFHMFMKTIQIEGKYIETRNNNNKKDKSEKSKNEFIKSNNMNRDIEFGFNMCKTTVNVGIQVEEQEEDLEDYAHDMNLKKNNSEIKSFAKLKAEDSNDKQNKKENIPKQVLIINQQGKIQKTNNTQDEDGNNMNNIHDFDYSPIDKRIINKAKPQLAFSFLTKQIMERESPQVKNINDNQLNFTSKSTRVFKQINSDNSHGIKCINKDIVPIIYNEDILNQQTKTLKKGIDNLSSLNQIQKSLPKQYSITNSWITKRHLSYPLKRLIFLQKFIKLKLETKSNYDKRRSNYQNNKSIVSRIQMLFIQMVKNKIISNSKRICFNIIKEIYCSKLNNESSKATIVDDYSQDDSNYETKKRNYVKVTEGLNVKESKAIMNTKHKSLIKSLNNNNNSLQIIEGYEGSDLEDVIDNYSFDDN